MSHATERRARIVGMISGSDVSFFHSLENVSISLKLNGTDFKGHDNKNMTRILRYRKWEMSKNI